MRSYQNIRWPYKGIDQGRSFTGQLPDTTPDALNVRNYQPHTGRSRGSQRAGLTKYCPDQINGAARVQDINHLVHSNLSVGTSTAINARTIVPLAVCDGDVKKFSSSAVLSVTNGTGTFTAGVPVFSSQHLRRMYYTDGLNAAYYNLDTDAMVDWPTAVTSGTFPQNGSNYPRLICMWQSCIVMSGLKGDEHNWFMSAIDDPLDWDYAPDPITVAQAIAGNNAPAGRIGDVVNSLVPYDRDTLIFLCDHSIHMMSGNPAAGGVIDEVTQITGGAWGRSWAKDDSGGLWFFGSRGGLYVLYPGQGVQRKSAGRLDEALNSVNLDTSLVRLVYDDLQIGVHIFITPLAGAESTHWFYDIRNEAFWKDSFTDSNMNPVAVHTFDGDNPSDRCVLLGGDDGYVRKIDKDAYDDDGVAIESHCWLGPYEHDKHARLQLREVRATLDTESERVLCSVYGGPSAQEAFESCDELMTFEIEAGRNNAIRERARGHALFFKLENCEANERWAFDSMQAHIVATGISAQRGL